MQNKDALIITKKAPETARRWRSINITQEVYDKIVALAAKANAPIGQTLSELAEFALERVVLKD